MTKPIHTPYFSGSEKPAYSGVYRRKRPVFDFLGNGPKKMQVRYNAFRNGQWYCEGSTPEEAAKRTEPSYLQDVPWCGLVEAQA